MATIKVKFRPSGVDGQEGSIYYQVLHDRVPRQIATPYKILPSEWDDRRGSIIIPRDPTPRKALLASIRDRVRLDLERLTRIIRRLDDTGVPYSGDDVCDEFHAYTDRLSLRDYMGRAIIRLRECGRKSTSGNYSNARSSFTRFLSSRGQDDVLLDCLTPQLIEDYQTHLQGRGVVRNTVSFYMRQLRAVYNSAVDDGLIEQRNPFRKVYTGIDKTVKRAIGLTALSGIVALDLSGDHRLDFARDMFVLSYYLRGMSFVDMAYLRKDSIQGGYLTYCRRKTGQRLRIKWTPEMQELLDKYPPNASGYLLPIIKSAESDGFHTYRNALSAVNRALKKIGEMVGLPDRLTHYAARHTWASAAQAQGVPVDVISEGMGHDSVHTTRIYLASLDTSDVDRANDRLIRSVRPR